MTDFTCACIGGSDVPYSMLTSALEGSAKAAGWSRSSAPDAKQLNIAVVQYENAGSWMLLFAEGNAIKDLAPMLATPLGKSVGRSLAAFVVVAKKTDAGWDTSAKAYDIDSTGKLTEKGTPEVSGSDEKDANAFAEAVMAKLIGAEAAPVNRQKRHYYFRPTTGNARLDRFVSVLRDAKEIAVTREEGNRFKVELQLPTGVKQTSFFSAKELETIQSATGQTFEVK